jgi:hypothetical protein
MLAFGRQADGRGLPSGEARRRSAATVAVVVIVIIMSGTDGCVGDF